MSTYIYQIFYDEATRRQVDIPFIALDNLANPRPDWREYWPIRKYLREKTLNENHLYGFFSPNFYAKTHLRPEQVFSFIDANPGNEVYTFTPFLHDSAGYLSIFEQGNRRHPGMAKLMTEFLDSIGLEVDLSKLTMDFRSTVYCNFMVARPSFWEKWFAINERLFDDVENGTSEFAINMNTLTEYDKSPVDMKVFVMERIASLILALDHSIPVAHFDMEQMPWSDPMYYPCRDELFTLNALKMAYIASADECYMRLFRALRHQVFTRCDLSYKNETPGTFFD